MRTRLPLMGPQTPRRCDVLRCGHWPVRLGVIRRVQPAGLAAENRPWHWPSSGGTVSRERCPIVRSLWRPSELGLERSQAYFKYVFLIYVTEFCANSIIHPRRLTRLLKELADLCLFFLKRLCKN